MHAFIEYSFAEGCELIFTATIRIFLNGIWNTRLNHVEYRFKTKFKMTVLNGSIIQNKILAVKTMIK
jgi:hypothetical protein